MSLRALHHRLATMMTPNTLQGYRSAALMMWAADLARGGKAGAPALYRHFHDTVTRETERLESHAPADDRGDAQWRVTFYLWCAHFLPVERFEQVFLLALKTRNKFELAAAQQAAEAVG